MKETETKKTRQRKRPPVVVSNRVLRLEAAQEKTGLRKWMFNERRKNDPRFPKPLKLSRRSVGYLEKELDAYIRDVMSKERG